MVRPLAYKALAAATFFSKLSFAAITACPNEEAVWETPIGVKYTVCPGSDYQYGGVSFQFVNNVNTTKECVQICDTDARCYRAVYDKQDRVCHVKNNNNEMNWVADDRFDSIRMTNDMPEGTFVSVCPFDEASYTEPKTKAEYRVCLNTDYVGASAKMVKDVTTIQACAELCSNTPNCKKSVFDNIENVCHIKAAEPDNSLFHVQNKRFATIRVPDISNPAVEGRWGDIIRLPLIPVAAYIVPAYPQPDRLLFFSSWGKDAFGGASGKTQYGDFNFGTGEISDRTVTNTHHDMFCPGISQLQDGRIVVQGGSDAEAVSIYDPATNNFTRGPDMKMARGYQTSTTLSNGKIFTIGGAYSGKREGKNGEMYDPVANEWTMLNGADVKPILTTDHEGIWREDNHAWLVGWKNGSVFQAGPGKDQHWFGTDGDGSVMKAATRDTDDAMCGIWVLYDAIAGKLLSAGGSPDYTDSDANKHAHITTIGDPNTPSEVERVADMAFPRGFANAVVLPDGTVLVTGGQRKSLVFTNTDSILIPELFNPETKEWKQMAPMAVPRNYHSVSILLPDATVFSGGGGLCYVSTIGGSTAKCDKTVDHADGEIFQPPYLFNEDGTAAVRPVISAIGTESLKAGATLNFTVEGVDGQGKVVLIRTGSVTHSVNSDQRRIPLNDVQVNGQEYSAKLPEDYGIMLPGYYYLFVSTPQGTPSVAKTVHIIL
ncbi:kelch domain-containing protein [Colletotrichum truncatum]|uniref:Kelch domain-containing protein n=1 Tax=Colletotrichum truncatum TaxID=5467 RepID=A0ACC3ZJL5_COLTU|nr:kelch domain-containing protein [Colletotrichum truncatum]KAF6799666.1 kelch domain-containing protein [Colletotrichum truncatum]